MKIVLERTVGVWQYHYAWAGNIQECTGTSLLVDGDN